MSVKVAAAVLLLTGLLTSPAHAEIIIGVAGPLSGPVASYGQQIKAGAQLAIDDINAQGGLLGQTLKLIDADDACEPKQAVNAANLMVKQKADLVLGHWCAGSSIVAAPIYNEEGLLMIDPGSIWSKLTAQAYPRVFRMAGTELVMGQAAAKVIAGRLHAQNLAVLEDQRSVTVALGQTVADASRKAGVTTVNDFGYTGGESDYNALLTKLKNLNPDVIYCSCYDLEAGLFVRQAAVLGLKAKFVGPETLASGDFIKIVGPQLAEKIMALDYTNLDVKNPAIKALQTRLVAQHIDGAAMMSFHTYAALQIYASAVKEAGTVEPVRVAAVIHRHAWDTLLGPISFAGNGDRQNISYSSFVWQNGILHEGEVIR
jgi:branched-chain amino acid transport system substrate-binding protein